MNKLNLINAEIRKLENTIAPTKRKINNLRERADKLEAKLESSILKAEASTVEMFENEGADNVWVIINGDDTDRKICEDDGALIITIGKIGAAFICNQEITQSEWNKQARPIVSKFGFKWSEINS